MKRLPLYVAGLILLCAAPALALPVQNVGMSNMFSTMGLPFVDDVVNTGLGFLYGPAGYGIAGVGLYRLYTELQDARHTGEYAHKTMLGSVGIALVGGGPAIYHGFATKAAQAAGLVIPTLLHHLH